MFEKGHKITRTGASRKIDATAVLKRESYLEAALSAPMSRGRDLYVKYVQNNTILTPMQAIVAQCAHCSGWYVDGKVDCDCPDCPLYLYMPYGKYRKPRVQGKTKSSEV